MLKSKPGLAAYKAKPTRLSLWSHGYLFLFVISFCLDVLISSLAPHAIPGNAQGILFVLCSEITPGKACRTISGAGAKTQVGHIKDKHFSHCTILSGH